MAFDSAVTLQVKYFLAMSEKAVGHDAVVTAYRPCPSCCAALNHITSASSAFGSRWGALEVARLDSPFRKGNGIVVIATATWLVIEARLPPSRRQPEVGRDIVRAAEARGGSSIAVMNESAVTGSMPGDRHEAPARLAARHHFDDEIVQPAGSASKARHAPTARRPSVRTTGERPPQRRASTTRKALANTKAAPR